MSLEMTNRQKVSIVVPVFNERATIAKLIERVLSIDLGTNDKEVIVIDDGSIDGTRDILKEMSARNGVRIFYHQKNRGKGASLRTGFHHATGEIIIIQDADLEYDPKEYRKLLEPIISGKADVVYGSRFHAGPRRVLLFWHFVGNVFLTLLSNALNNLTLSDMETCYKVFTRRVLAAITLRSNRFGFEPEFTAKVARKKFRIYEVPISYSGRDYSEGKKITWKDGVRAIFAIIWYRFFD